MVIAWPESWPTYKQTCSGSWDKACDIVVGPCCCGAWHQKGEFTFRNGVLRRYGMVVAVKELAEA